MDGCYAYDLHKGLGVLIMNPLFSNTKIMGICSLLEWFSIQMPSTLVVGYSDHHFISGLVFRSSFEYRSAVQMLGTMVGHLNSKPYE